MLSFLLVPLYVWVLPSRADYGEVSFIFSYFVLFNVILAYGMETAFFRFYNKEADKEKVVGTSVMSLVISSLGFFILGYLFQNTIANLTDIRVDYIKLVIWILLLDAMAIIPFAWLRAIGRPVQYAVIKIVNVVVNISLNLFFLLWLKDLSFGSGLFYSICKDNFEISYIFIANVAASAVTLLLLLPFYIKAKYQFNANLWKQMMRYAFPVLLAGVAFSINETFDRILLEKLLPKNIAMTEIGMYSACYKIAVFMTLFVTAYKLGIEPFFFSQAQSENPQKNYAKILEFFVALGALLFLGIVVFADVLKPFIVTRSSYWEAMWVVPVILLANFCLGIYHNLSVWYKITDRTKFGAYISIFGAIITLGLNFWLIPIMSYRGSAIATLAAYTSMMVISYWLGRKYYPIPYNLKKIGAYLVVSVLFSAISFYGFRYNLLVGVGLLLAFSGMVYALERQDINRLIKRN